MENMDKGLTGPKWVLISQSKIPQMPQNVLAKLSAQAEKFAISMKKGVIGRLQSVFLPLHTGQLYASLIRLSACSLQYRQGDSFRVSPVCTYFSRYTSCTYISRYTSTPQIFFETIQSSQMNGDTYNVLELLYLMYLQCLKLV